MVVRDGGLMDDDDDDDIHFNFNIFFVNILQFSLNTPSSNDSLKRLEDLRNNASSSS